MAGNGDTPTTAYDRLASRIRKQILSGELRPGDRLPTEPELSSAYQVSRNTAREALRALASQGLLTVKRGVSGGTFVSAPSPAQISESLQAGLALLADSTHLSVSALVEIREMLEVPAAELAARHRTEEELACIRDALFDPATVDPHTVFTHNRDFHTRVLQATHNPLIEVLAEPVFRVLKERFLREQAPPEFWVRVDEEHREILGYLESGDQAGAREATRAHLRYLRATYERIDRERSAAANGRLDP
ncbi:FadR/GntR family transcriptional regulator [Amycolatopsis sp. GM8]|uniref:FadR/GntR family transcriptional regulator n=1 Tax=Amycolatopsis sp. GM8 TaxID=2896530 RepID=UPI001F48B12A|nr:FadR/GntR family transcriptional regulator [Amycolatopsis sp. GM8]